MSNDRLLLLAYTRCNQPAREEEWSAWYDDTHLPDVIEAGADVASRFALTQRPAPGMPSIGFSHVAIYEFRGFDAAARLELALGRDSETRRLGRLHPNHCLIQVDVLQIHKGRRLDPSPKLRGLIYVSVMCNDPLRTAEWNQWYDEQHLPDMMASGAFAAGSRWLRRESAPYGPNDVTFYDVTDCSVEDAIEVSARALRDLTAAGRKLDCHAAGMSVTLQPTGRYGGEGLWREPNPG